MTEFRLQSSFEPEGDQPAGDRARWSSAPAPATREQVLLGVTGSGKTFTIAKVVEALAAPDAGALAQQDPGGAAVPGVPRLLPRQRGRVLRLLLRLLPARGLRPADRHLHREGDHRSTRTSSGCACAPPPRCSSAATCSSSPRSRASTAWARPRPSTACCTSSSAGDATGIERRAAAPGRRCSTSAPTSTSIRGSVPRARRRARDACPPTTSAASASSTSATRSSGCSASTRCAATRSRRSTRSPVYPQTHYVTPQRPHGARHRRPSSASSTSGWSSC